MTWNQLLLSTDKFTDLFTKFKQLYKKDKELKKWVKKDCKNMGRKLTENQINFILEEVLIMYLALKGKIRLNNDFVQDKERWILYCYPGKPLYTDIYFFQKNPFKLENPKNKYENCHYDLEEQKLYDFSKIDLETLKL